MDRDLCKQKRWKINWIAHCIADKSEWKQGFDDWKPLVGLIGKDGEKYYFYHMHFCSKIHKNLV